MIRPTMESLNLLKKIADDVPTFHLHYHVLYDLAKSYPDAQKITYLEIGSFKGASACLLLQRPNTQVLTIDKYFKEEVTFNIEYHNPHKNEWHFICGDSNSPDVVGKVNEITQGINILFIDGEHSYKAVHADFESYARLVSPGGFVVFDDYNDIQATPGVRRAVDEIASNNAVGWQAIGAFENTLGAPGFPAEEKKGNDFIMRRLL